MEILRIANVADRAVETTDLRARLQAELRDHGISFRPGVSNVGDGDRWGLEVVSSAALAAPKKERSRGHPSSRETCSREK